MERYQKIIKHSAFLEYVDEIREAEKTRIYCCHGPEHLMDVARIAYIRNLELGLGFSKDIVYGTALLHDIGKSRQYKDGTPHEKGGSEMAKGILSDCGYDKEERDLMTRAIFYHRRGNDPENRPLSMLLYEADKLSRQCMFCNVQKECNWSEDKKNKTILC